MSLKRKIVYILVFVLFAAVFINMPGFAQDVVKKYIPDQVALEEGMTLWQVIKSGGIIMIVLSLLSIGALSLIIYYFVAFKEEKLLPDNFTEEVLDSLEKGKLDRVKERCGSKDNLLSGALAAALSRTNRDKAVIKESIQDEARREMDDLWQQLSYLADIASIAPMVGLLGTVLGMIQAFNVIAFQTGAVKPVLLASGISKAMVTTAAGLIIAIPAMLFHSFFKGRLQKITSQLEDILTESYYYITSGKK